ncbi:MAG: V/A-type H+-transporting ATPase subunit B [Rhodothermales bacterium]|jgi:V/A-type H+-transporting ATPase subunit B
MQKVYTRLLRVAGNVATLRAPGVKFGELATIVSRRGRSLGEVIRVEGDLAHVQVFAGCVGVGSHAQVHFHGRGMGLRFSDDLLGRVFGGSGQPLDGGPELMADLIEISTQSVNPTRRTVPNRMIRTNIPMIDVFNTLVVSQKLPIFSLAGEPYNELLCRIAMQAEADIIVLGGMGLKYDDYLYFRETLEDGGALGRSIAIIHTAADPVVECLMVPDSCLTIAERFALAGKDVLVPDMTNFADALKETAVTMEQVPSNRGYPGDLYSQLARRYEKAVDFEGAGSVTVLAVTTMPGGDVTHPVPDNTGYITEGQLFLHDGRIDPFGSLSRLKQLVNQQTRDDHRELMDALIRLYASCQETLEKRAMGFHMSDWDERLLRFGSLFEQRLMSLSVNVALEQALDTAWQILADCFEPQDVGLRSELLTRFWPASEAGA